jgi:hypothetical protein
MCDMGANATTCRRRAIIIQGNYYCLPPAGVLLSQNKVIKCAAYGVAQARGLEVWVDRWAEEWI